MVYRSDYDSYLREVEEARRAVAKAMEEHSKGGSVVAVTKANRRLADAHDAARMLWPESARPSRASVLSVAALAQLAAGARW